MTSKHNTPPEGYNSVTAYLTVKDADAALAYYTAAFGATERMRLDMPGGLIGHAEIEIGDSVIMLADESEDFGNQGPETLGGTPVSLMIYVDDVDAVFAQALDAGGSEVQPVEAKFYGDRAGTLKDPFGHVWTIATQVESLSVADIKARMAEAMESGSGL